jgi:hypothetical protein
MQKGNLILAAREEMTAAAMACRVVMVCLLGCWQGVLRHACDALIGLYVTKMSESLTF